jgi:hypothetical protein
LNIPKDGAASDGNEETIIVDDLLDTEETISIDLDDLDLTYVLDD